VITRRLFLAGAAATASAFAQQDDRVLKIVEAARDFDQRLPNFICKQTTQRYAGKTANGPWKRIDWHEEELTYFERKEKYRVMTINGKASNRTHDRLPGGFRANSLFGGVLSRIFRAETKTDFEWTGSTAIEAGHTANVVRYRVRKENSKWTADSNGKSYLRPYHGSIWADAETHAVLRIDATPEPEPGDPSWLGAIHLDIRYGSARVGGVEQFLPLRAESILGLPKVLRNVVEFSDFRQYAAESKIEFGDAK
jgi:hypothetical protein